MYIQNKRALGVFGNRQDAEKALNALKNTGFDMDNVSVIVRDSEAPLSPNNPQDYENVEGNKSDEGAITGATTGGILGTITGLLVGLGTLAIPGVGPVILAGATATAVATTLAGTAIGAAAGSLIGGLIGLGIPEEQAKIYSDRIAKGDYLIVVTGDQLTIYQAEKILRQYSIQEWTVYDLPNTSAVDNTPTVLVVDTPDQTNRQNLI
ncbi:general stress protein [Gloeocapsa sp. PCC 73106]|uniref:general stress protein n=1 Tax=Gloeocapsa sp. PCC 73106 TaxID=102232 RepID=UPI0002ABA908|nr:general stress protein [Gloeocapsa sp. PCC 73106]ELR96404.1 hypothetical protein GLO73106DRAFT_00001980 [Gloeocapsa sp. PCC 73106]